MRPCFCFPSFLIFTHVVTLSCVAKENSFLSSISFSFDKLLYVSYLPAMEHRNFSREVMWRCTTRYSNTPPTQIYDVSDNLIYSIINSGFLIINNRVLFITFFPGFCFSFFHLIYGKHISNHITFLQFDCIGPRYVISLPDYILHFSLWITPLL